jgi:hypothetical protein
MLLLGGNSGIVNHSVQVLDMAGHGLGVHFAWRAYVRNVCKIV